MGGILLKAVPLERESTVRDQFPSDIKTLLVFVIFHSSETDQPTDRPTDRQTDRALALAHLKPIYCQAKGEGDKTHVRE